MRFLIPENLETERLTLRRFQNDDWRGLHAIYSDEEAVRFTMQRTMSEAESWRIMASVVGHWELREYGPYALELKQTGEVVGIVGLWYPFEWPSPEIKWSVAPAHWGNGYASEAARAVQKMCAESMPELALISLILAGNVNSIRVAEAVGAVLESETEFRGQRALIFRHPTVEV